MMIYHSNDLYQSCSCGMHDGIGAGSITIITETNTAPYRDEHES